MLLLLALFKICHFMEQIIKVRLQAWYFAYGKKGHNFDQSMILIDE